MIPCKGLIHSSQTGSLCAAPGTGAAPEVDYDKLPPEVAQRYPLSLRRGARDLGSLDPYCTLRGVIQHGDGIAVHVALLRGGVEVSQLLTDRIDLIDRIKRETGQTIGVEEVESEEISRQITAHNAIDVGLAILLALVEVRIGLLLDLPHRLVIAKTADAIKFVLQRVQQLSIGCSPHTVGIGLVALGKVRPLSVDGEEARGVGPQGDLIDSGL